MATLAEIYALKASSATLRHRVAVALATAAEAVRNEAASTVSHAERFAWATAMLGTANGPEDEARRLMWMVLQNATVQDAGEAATDSDIQFVVNGLVDFAAGVDTSV